MQNPPQKEFAKIISSLTYRHEIWRVFSDFCEMAAITFSNAIIKDQEREDRYLQIVKGYEPKELQQFPALLACVIEGLEGMDCDFLGELFMQLELSNHWKGQFFTPFCISKMMAMMTAWDAAEMLKEKEFVTVSEPACGAGGMIIGLAAALKEQDVNYQQRIHVTAVDVDDTAAHMCFVQLSLLHVPAIVVIGNTLSMETRSVWKTPAHHLGFWDIKLKRGANPLVEAAADIATPTPAPAPVPAPAAAPMGQLDFGFARP